MSATLIGVLSAMLPLVLLLVGVVAANASSAPSFAAKRDEYAARWKAMKITPSRNAELTVAVSKIFGYKARYEPVAKQLGIPWFLIGCLHMRESSCNFHTHLHNGDPLTARTRHVPANRPTTGHPPYTWEESALDALKMPPHALQNVKVWSVERFLYEVEKYNGWGYAYRGKPSPYVFGWSSECPPHSGKFVADGRYSPTADESQPGVASLLKQGAERDPSILNFSLPTPEAPKPIVKRVEDVAPVKPVSPPSTTAKVVVTTVTAGGAGAATFVTTHPFIVAGVVAAVIGVIAAYFIFRKKPNV